MFVQVFQAQLRDADLWRRRVDVWRHDIKPITTGFLGFTSGVTSARQMITIARFASEEAAAADSDLAAQGAWFEASTAAFDGEVTFHDCREVDVFFDGGSDSAGFVQVTQGRAKDPAAMRAAARAMEPNLGRVRPDLLGSTVAWHADGSGFTQASYFTSEDEARANEKAMADDPSFAAFGETIDGPLTFFDLSDPMFE